MTASFEGKTIHRVLSTFQLVYYAELAARRMVEPYLQEGEDAAGAGICLNHVAPAKIGEVVSVTASLSKIDRRIVACGIEGRTSGRIICSGTQTHLLIKKGSSD